MHFKNLAIILKGITVSSTSQSNDSEFYEKICCHDKACVSKVGKCK